MHALIPLGGVHGSVQGFPLQGLNLRCGTISNRRAWSIGFQDGRPSSVGCLLKMNYCEFVDWLTVCCAVW